MRNPAHQCTRHACFPLATSMFGRSKYLLSTSSLNIASRHFRPTSECEPTVIALKITGALISFHEASCGHYWDATSQSRQVRSGFLMGKGANHTCSELPPTSDSTLLTLPTLLSTP